jgi:hypothetical protein
MTISQHISTAGWSMALFSAVATIASCCTAYSLLFVVRPRWDFGHFGTLLAAVIPICMLIIGAFPHSVGNTSTISSGVHQIAAWIIIIALLVLMIYMLTIRRQQISAAIRLLAIGALTYGAAVLITALIFGQFYLDNAFFFETIFMGITMAYILLLNYSKPKLQNSV